MAKSIFNIITIDIIVTIIIIIIIIHMENCMTKPKHFLTSGFSYQDIVAQRSSPNTAKMYKVYLKC